MPATTTRNITVSVTPRFLTQQSNAEIGMYAWSYNITLENLGHETVQLINRYWHITDGRGFVQEVYGAGVVGKQPTLKPNDRFEYTSWVLINTPTGIMKGHYEMRTIFGEKFSINIPNFQLEPEEQMQVLSE